MCVPALLVGATALSSTASAAATVFSIFSSVMKFQQMQDQADYTRGVAEYNARVKENEATKVANKGVEAENAHRQKVARLASQQRAEFGAKNVDINSGSPLAVQQDTQILGEADALRIKSNFKDQATSLLNQAEITRMEGQARATGLENQAIGSLLSGIGGIASSGIADKWFGQDSSAISGGESKALF